MRRRWIGICALICGLIGVLLPSGLKRFAALYPRHEKDFNEAHLPYDKEVLQNAHFKPGNISILDVGTGIGNMLQQMKTIFGPRAKLSGVDIYKSQYWVFNGDETVDFVVYDGKSLPFADNQFDLVSARYVLHHAPANEHILDELIRVSKAYIYLLELTIDTSSFEGLATALGDDYVNWIVTAAEPGVGQSTWFRPWNQPHTFRHDEGWMQLFAERNVTVVGRRFAAMAVMSLKDRFVPSRESEESCRNDVPWPYLPYPNAFYLLKKNQG